MTQLHCLAAWRSELSRRRAQKYFFTIHSGCHWSGVRFLPVRSEFSYGLFVEGTLSLAPDLTCHCLVNSSRPLDVGCDALRLWLP